MRFLLLLHVLLAAHTALAGEPTGVVVTGDASLQPQLLAHLEERVRSHGDELVASALPAEAIDAVDACFARDDEACAKQVIDTRASASVVIYARIQVTAGADRSSDVALTVYRFTKGEDSIADRRFCERCTAQSLAAAADELLAALAKSASAATGTLRLASTPPGAKVMIGGNPVGITPVVHALAPGEHDVAVLLDGHELESRTVVVRANETTTVEVPLTPVRTTRKRRTLPVVLAIGGLAALGTGIVLVAIDEDPSPSGPRQIRNSAPAGVALTAGGALLAAAGVWLWLRGDTSAGTPVAAVSRGGGVVGWSTNF